MKKEDDNDCKSNINHNDVKQCWQYFFPVEKKAGPVKACSEMNDEGRYCGDHIRLGRGKKIQGQRGQNKKIEYRPHDPEHFFRWSEVGLFQFIIPSCHYSYP